MKLQTNIFLVAVGLLAGINGASAQKGENLVPNGSFEEHTKKPKKLNSIESATGWVSPTGVRADLFTSGGIPDIDVPLNKYGKEEAKDGNSYIGLVAYGYGGKFPRSYAMTKLDAPLKKDMYYCVKMSVSLAESSKYAVNNLGIVLSNKQFGTDGKVSIIEEPSLMHFNNDTKLLSARYDWTEICGMYQAKGGEKFITLGNFIADDRTKNERMKKAEDLKVVQEPIAYYYIDQVSLVLIDRDRGEKCECAAEESGDEYSTTIYQRVFTVKEDLPAKDKIEHQQLFFAFGRDRITTEGESALNTIADLMKENPDMRLQINGHNNAMEDSVGTENDYYADMDNKRIAAIVQYLSDKGISSGRLIPAPQGSDVTNPDIAEDDSEDLKMAKERRITFKVRE